MAPFSSLTRRSMLVGAGWVGAWGALPFHPAIALSGNPDPAAVVATTTGKIRGGLVRGVHVFRGVPFGEPTGGENRFRYPRARRAWAGVRDCLQFGDRAPQEFVTLEPARTSDDLRRNIDDTMPTFQDGMSEDCLNLNLWTPTLERDAGLPVLVWLHPGGFEFGSANLAFSDGTNIARRGDAIVVGINHRLGALGFLHLSDLVGDGHSHNGNLGLHDIILGLKWVRDNIESFGGDPQRVLIFGESGGARKVSTLLAMREAKDLFSRAAMQSGPGIRFPSNENQTRRAELVLEELGLARNEAARLRDVPAELLVRAGVRAGQRIRAQLEPGVPFYETYGFAPVVGSGLENAPFDPAAPETARNVPIMIGTNRHEMSLSYTADRRFDLVDREQLEGEAERIAGRHADLLLAGYRQSYPEVSNRDLLLLMTADHSHRKDSITLAERKLQLGGADVFMYRFDWESPVFGGLMKAAHTYEIPHVFDNTQLCAGMTGGTADALVLAQRMSDAWVNFARDGSPQTPDLPEWQAYNLTTRTTMVFDNDCRAVADPGRAERLLWRKVESEQGLWS
ncbi:carboxylesterase/lipase family protein [Aurantiacibacter gilvus]|uniref:Carboxylic ester hydrolase n=1 Tax=Aurantiacibacter gilvus TaxID=3139141 RepID=A0ABU9IF96_9SPHN